MMTIALAIMNTMIRTNFSHYIVLFHENVFQRTNLLFTVVQYISLRNDVLLLVLIETLNLSETD